MICRDNIRIKCLISLAVVKTSKKLAFELKALKIEKRTITTMGMNRHEAWDSFMKHGE